MNIRKEDEEIEITVSDGELSISLTDWLVFRSIAISLNKEEVKQLKVLIEDL